MDADQWSMALMGGRVESPTPKKRERERERERDRERDRERGYITASTRVFFFFFGQR